MLLRKGVGISAALDLKFTLSGRRQRDLAEPIPRGKSWGFLVVLLFWCFVFFFSTMHFEPLIKGDFIFPSAAAEGREGHGRAITAGRGGTSLPASWILAFPIGILVFPAGRQHAGRQAGSLAAAGSHRHLQPAGRAGCDPSWRSSGRWVCATQPQWPSDTARPRRLTFNEETIPFPC